MFFWLVNVFTNLLCYFVLGNKDVQSSNYEDAIIRYTSAIALCENAVYYCNR